jgi:hypothetical protein
MRPLQNEKVKWQNKSKYLNGEGTKSMVGNKQNCKN